MKIIRIFNFNKVYENVEEIIKQHKFSNFVSLYTPETYKNSENFFIQNDKKKICGGFSITPTGEIFSIYKTKYYDEENSISDFVFSLAKEMEFNKFVCFNDSLMKKGIKNGFIPIGKMKIEKENNKIKSQIVDTNRPTMYFAIYLGEKLGEIDFETLKEHLPEFKDYKTGIQIREKTIDYIKTKPKTFNQIYSYVENKIKNTNLEKEYESCL